MTREEAIKEIRRMSLPKETMEILKALAPELAESEDERIRKEIVECIETLLKAPGASPRLCDWLAYLEKQKAKEKYDRMTPIYNDQQSFEDALEKAWDFYNNSGARTVDSCEDNYVECAHAKGFREGFLFGIEKQKEPIPIPDKFSGLKSLLLQYLQSAANRKDDTEIESDTDLWGRKILNYVWKYSEKQKEPHYTKRNALFDKCVANCDPAVMKRVSDEVDEKQKEQKQYDIDVLERHITKDSVSELAHTVIVRNGWEIVEAKEQKPAERNKATINGEPISTENQSVDIPLAEWSEEDEHCIELLDTIIDSSALIPKNRIKCHSFLKSLRPQPHTVSIKDATKFGNLEYERGVKDGIQSEKSRQWKPSEEQMKALNEIINTLAVSKHPHESDYLFNMLNGLRKDLKKL